MSFNGGLASWVVVAAPATPTVAWWCLHKQRKGLGKTDTTVYGISSDAMNFTFMKLDNESQWAFKLVGVVGNAFEQVLSLLVYLMKKAATMSRAPLAGYNKG
ncbi:hypothetical protein E8E15_011035 [Penicillium rubens]|nr:hypothetical protein E8E15_011035 [Penicillium rubens]KAJ5845525.1 hypothetical protein N7534_009194 [Penicillium rubens]